MDSRFQTPFGHFKLKRIPDFDKNLRAWDNADLFLLNYLAENNLPGGDKNVLLVNDNFGALTVALSSCHIDNYNDSWVSHQAAQENLKYNDLQQANVEFIKSTELLEKQYDLVLIKTVKTLALLEEELINIKPRLNTNAIVIGAAMAKNLHRSMLELFSHLLGPATASLAWKKARLIHVEIDPGKPRLYSNYPQTFKLDENGSEIYNLANVFSKHKLDIGSRFFLQHFPSQGEFYDIIDLGCGNGVLALKAAQLYPQSHITCIDESYMAVESARLTLNNNLLNYPEQTFKANNGLENYPEKSADLILCNPPFHQQHAVGDGIAWTLFMQSKNTLRVGGELWIVGNRHLGYHTKLNKLFGNYKLIASNKKFVVLKSVKK